MSPNVARTMLPDDDLYERLGVPVDASPEAIDVAWRALLRKHHPDIAGQAALELAKRINVAHDWLSDSALRRRYDTERGIGQGFGRDRHPIRPPDRAAWGRSRDVDAEGAWGRRPRPPTTEERVAAVVARVPILSPDELDRLAMAEPAPIAFLATLRRFARPDLQSILDDAERAVLAALPSGARGLAPIRDAVLGQLAAIVLDDALDGLLGDSRAERARERLTRGWEAAVGQPRYGPATNAVTAFVARLRAFDARSAQDLARTGTRERLGAVPWPPSVSPDEDEALRVSADLAGIDAAAALADALAEPVRHVPIGARRAAARIGHLLVLRHAFAPVDFDRLAAPWSGDLVPRIGPWGPRVGPRR